MKVFRNSRLSGQPVGVCSGDVMEGVVSHLGERFHVHYIDEGLMVSGYVDQYSVRAGAVLWLPKK